MVNKIAITGFNDKIIEIIPHLKLVEVTDFLGEKQHNLAFSANATPSLFGGQSTVNTTNIPQQ